MRAGFTLAIVGRPNVGKSSLFNRLLEQDRAIVTDIPGTTRDLVSETASIGGIPVKLYDTAGIRAGSELVESLGIERSLQAMADADLTLVVVDLSQGVTAEDRELMARAPKMSDGRQQVRSCRTHACRRPRRLRQDRRRDRRACVKRFSKPSRPRGAFEQETGFITSVRHERLLAESAEYLEKARGAVEDGNSARDAAARSLRGAASHRRHHRRDHRRRHSQPDLFDVLYREVMRAAIASSRAIRWSGHRPLPSSGTRFRRL